MFFSSSIVNPVICLSFVETYRPELRNIYVPALQCEETVHLVMRKRAGDSKRDTKPPRKSNINNQLLRTATSSNNHCILWQTLSPENVIISRFYWNIL